MADDPENRRKWNELRINAEGLIFVTEKAIEEYGQLIPPHDLAAIEQDVQALKRALEGDDDDQIRAALRQLAQVTSRGPTDYDPA